MKKLLLIPLLLVALACSSDEMDDSNSRTTDPLIGTWDTYLVDSGNSSSSDWERVTVKSDGTWATVSGYDGFWLNISESEDFSNYLQSYRLTVNNDISDSSDIEMNFEDDWNSLIFDNEGGTYLWEKISD